VHGILTVEGLEVIQRLISYTNCRTTVPLL